MCIPPQAFFDDNFAFEMRRWHSAAPTCEHTWYVAENLREYCNACGTSKQWLEGLIAAGVDPFDFAWPPGEPIAP